MESLKGIGVVVGGRHRIEPGLGLRPSEVPGIWEEIRRRNCCQNGGKQHDNRKLYMIKAQ